MGSIKVWRGEGCRPRLAVEDVLISLPTLRLSRKEGGKKWGTPGAYFYILGIRNWLRQVSGEMSRDRGKGWRHHSGSFLNLRDKAGAITNAFSWPLIDDHPPLVLSLSLNLLTAVPCFVSVSWIWTNEKNLVSPGQKGNVTKGES